MKKGSCCEYPLQFFSANLDATLPRYEQAKSIFLNYKFLDKQLVPLDMIKFLIFNP